MSDEENVPRGTMTQEEFEAAVKREVDAFMAYLWRKLGE